jgi:16S rRNA (cytosine1402-N4)-methyltransferase
MMTKNKHQPVLLDQVLTALDIKPGYWYVDATFGHGGHTKKIIEKNGKVLAIDYDWQNIKHAQNKFATLINNQQLILVNANFNQLLQIVSTKLNQEARSKIAGILFDFGTTSEQLSDQQSGISFWGSNQELDMRIDKNLGVRAKDLLAVLSQKQLQHLFGEFGGEREASRISKEIAKRRQVGEYITTVSQLVSLIKNTKKHFPKNIHPATKVFQALRIAVNSELENIEQALPQALKILALEGVIVTIAFHQGEDRLAKQLFVLWEKNNLGLRLTKKPIVPTPDEISQNPNSRSAKMRIFKKTNQPKT